MKFSEMSKTDWMSLQLYFDTCILPISGLKGNEAPWQMADQLERLRDALDAVEIPFKGRVVTLPAVQYRTAEDEQFVLHISEIAANCKSGGFKHVIAVSGCADLINLSFEHVDLFLVSPQKNQALELVANLWLNQD